jgi:alpha-1,6-mannosyltransferase
VGSACILLGLAQGGSPFTLQVSGAWFFGVDPRVATNARFLGVMLVYVGVALMIGSWFEIVRTVRRQPHTPLGHIVAVGVAWILPVLVMPPLFSRDVYSYAAQGEMVRRGINPYLHGPVALGPGRFLTFVDPLWRRAPAPYGRSWTVCAGCPRRRRPRVRCDCRW